MTQDLFRHSGMDADKCNLMDAQSIDRRSPCRHREEALRRSDRADMVGKVFSILTFIMIALVATAQSSGKLHLLIDPPATFSYKLDHRFIMQQAGLELLEGAHHFSFWAPQRKLMDTTITIAGGDNKTLALRLPFSAEYLVYQRDLKAYRKDMRIQRLIPAGATGASLIYTAVKYGKMKKAHDRLEDDRKAYDEAGAPNAITVLKDETIPSHKDDFEKARTGYRVSAGITVLFAGVTTYMYLRSAKQKKPVFIDAEKVRFDGLSWMPGAHGGEWTGGLTWNFSR